MPLEGCPSETFFVQGGRDPPPRVLRERKEGERVSGPPLQTRGGGRLVGDTLPGAFFWYPSPPLPSPHPEANACSRLLCPPEFVLTFNVSGLLLMGHGVIMGRGFSGRYFFDLRIGTLGGGWTFIRAWVVGREQAPTMVPGQHFSDALRRPETLWCLVVSGCLIERGFYLQTPLLSDSIGAPDLGLGLGTWALGPWAWNRFGNHANTNFRVS